MDLACESLRRDPSGGGARNKRPRRQKFSGEWGADVILVMHDEGLWETRFLHQILDGLVTSEVVDLDLSFVPGDTAIHVINTNRIPLRGYEAYFERCRASASSMTLIHLADEWFDGDYGVYRHFDHVLRQFHTWLAECPGILTIPLGFGDEVDGSRASKPAAERRYVWSFAGMIKSSRIEMAHAMSRLHPHCLADSSKGGQRLDRAAYDEVMRDSVFVPCPMGAVLVDTVRPFEALELGCIPLIESRFLIDYHHKLLGPNPIPAFRSWKAAALYCEALMRDPAALSETQHEVRSWWASYKRSLRERIGEFVRSPSHRPALAEFAVKLRNRHQALHQPLRLLELLRHQSAASLARRLLRPGPPAKRILAALTRR